MGLTDMGVDARANAVGTPDGERDERLVAALRLCVAATIVSTPLGFWLRLESPSQSQRAVFAAMGLLCGFLVAGAVLARPRLAPRVTGAWWVAWGLQWAVLLLAAARSAESSYALSSAMLTLSGMAWFAAIVVALRPGLGLRSMAALWVILGVVLSLHGLAQSLGWGVAREVFLKSRAVSLLGHPSHLASALVPIFFIALSGKTNGRGCGRWAHQAVLGVLGVGLLLTGTRAAWLAVGLGLCAHEWLRRRAGARPTASKRRIALWIGATAIAVTLFTLPNPWFSPRFDLAQRLVSGVEVRSRLYSWLIAVDMARERPLLGHGPGAYAARFWEYVDRRQASPAGQWFEPMVISMDGIPPAYPHNEFLSLACESGLVGLAAFMGLVACGWSAAVRLSKNSPGAVSDSRERGVSMDVAPALGAGLVACLIDASFAFPFQLAISWAGFVFILALLCSMDQRNIAKTLTS